jgi:hypothetical protein
MEKELLTIKEASIFSGIAVSTIYKAIHRGIISVEYDIIQGKKIKKVRKSDIKKVYNLANNTEEFHIIYDNIFYNIGENRIKSDIKPKIERNIKQEILSDNISHNIGENRIKSDIKANSDEKMKPELISDNSGEYRIISDIIRENIEIEYEKISEIIRENIKQALEKEQKAIVKTIKEQSLFIAGALTKENEFLKDKISSLLDEIEKYKAFPLEDITALKKENKTLQKQNTEINNKLLEKEQTLKKKDNELNKLQLENEDMKRKFNKKWW